MIRFFWLQKPLMLYFLWLLTPSAFASVAHPFYFGIGAGYGSTTWWGLVPTNENQNEAMILSTPSQVREGGIAGGFFIGYEFFPFLALEGSYTKYPNAKISFDEMSLVTFQYDITSLTTKTELIALLAKLMVPLPYTYVRLFSGFGISDLHRSDRLADRWRLSPTFSFGFNYDLNEHWMTELAANYTSGYGESEINPAKDYIPFLFGVFLHLAYKI